MHVYSVLELAHCNLPGPVDPIVRETLDDYSSLIIVDFLRLRFVICFC